MRARRWADRLDAAALDAFRSKTGRRASALIGAIAAIACILLGVALGLPSLVYGYVPGLVGAGLALVIGVSVGAASIASMRTRGAP